jgi:protein-tyrosine phosphatase
MKMTCRSFLIPVLIASLATWLVLLGLERWQREEENYSLIEEGLYMGGSVTQPPPGTDAVLNLCEKADPYTCPIHLWQPIPDTAPAPNLDWLRRMVEFVQNERQAGRTVYVHCKAGVSRSGMVVIAYVMQKYHWTRDQALAYARSKRPGTRPNPAFMERLLEWERLGQEQATPASTLEAVKTLHG